MKNARKKLRAHLGRVVMESVELYASDCNSNPMTAERVVQAELIKIVREMDTIKRKWWKR